MIALRYKSYRSRQLGQRAQPIRYVLVTAEVKAGSCCQDFGFALCCSRELHQTTTNSAPHKILSLKPYPSLPNSIYQLQSHIHLQHNLSTNFVITMPRAVRGVLVECDPSIKAIIEKIDAEKNDVIVENLDERHLVVKEEMLPTLKLKLEDHLRETQQQPDDSGSD